METDDQQVVSVDAKVSFDDNAQFRQKEIFAMEDATEMDPQEYAASKQNLNYIRMDGNIGCLGNCKSKQQKCAIDSGFLQSTVPVLPWPQWT